MQTANESEAAFTLKTVTGIYDTEASPVLKLNLYDMTLYDIVLLIYTAHSNLEVNVTK